MKKTASFFISLILVAFLNQLSSVYAASLSADINGNGCVDIFDYTSVLATFGKTGIGHAGDIDKDNDVDIFDFNIIISQFGQCSQNQSPTTTTPHLPTPTKNVEIPAVKDKIIEIMIDDGTLYTEQPDGYSYPNNHIILPLFYQKHPDIYDFVTLFDDKTLYQGSYHHRIKNQIKGVSMPINFDYSSTYGSKGRLLGANSMNSIDDK